MSSIQQLIDALFTQSSADMFLTSIGMETLRNLGTFLQTTLTIHIGLELYIILRQKMIQVKSGQIIKARTNLNFGFLYA